VLTAGGEVSASATEPPTPMSTNAPMATPKATAATAQPRPGAGRRGRLPPAAQRAALPPHHALGTNHVELLPRIGRTLTLHRDAEPLLGGPGPALIRVGRGHLLFPLSTRGGAAGAGPHRNSQHEAAV
jgi:hypothetical protein